MPSLYNFNLVCPSKMASSFCGILLFFLSIWGFTLRTCSCNPRIFSFPLHHRFSEPVKKWSELTGKGPPSGIWPEKGTVEYYAQLAHHDRALSDRVEGPVTFSDGNSTLRISALGFLHYTTVSLGTPEMKFMVALDTGSDLFWVPCDCDRCAPTEGMTYGSDFELRVYNPRESSTSKNVTCSSSLCAQQSRCLDASGSCPYIVSYVSAETSTSGILLEDVLHLTAERGDPEYVEAYITFGCGQVQTGSFLDVAAPNGLLGLGMEKISVPTILSTEGYTSDSFSMCFGRDGTGRISFGDKGSADQEITPLNVNPSHPAYNIAVTQIRVGTALIDLGFAALFDSGTSFTYLVDPIYTKLSDNFHSQAQDRRRPHDSRIPFEFCYDMSPDTNISLVPSLRITLKGGSHFPVHDPIIVISSQRELAYCLAVVRSTELNIIGQNFMTGYRVVFNREELILGWKDFDCYDIEDENTFSIKPRNSDSVPPAVAAGVGNQTSTNPSRNYSQSSDAPFFSYHAFTCREICFMSLIISFLFYCHLSCDSLLSIQL